MKSRIRSLASVLVPLAIALLFSIGGLSCTDLSEDEPTVSAVHENEIVITAESLAALAPGERLLLDQMDTHVYTFDFSKAEIDFSRIDMLTKEGKTVPMDRWLSSEQGKKKLQSPTRSFRVTNNGKLLQAMPRIDTSRVEKRQVAMNVWVCVYTYIHVIVCEYYQLEDGSVLEICTEVVYEELVCWWEDDPEP